MGLGNVIKGVFSGGKEKVIEAVGNTLDKVFTNKEEVQAGKIEMEKVISAQFIRMEELSNQANADAQKELTERLKIDMASDSKLSKNIRPMTLIYLLILFTGLIVIDSIGGLNFNVDEGYKEIIKYLLMAVFSFYFIGRGIEKVMSKK